MLNLQPYLFRSNCSYPDGSYTLVGLEAVVGYEGETANGIGWYVSGGPTVTHTEAADEFGDVSSSDTLVDHTISSTEKSLE